MAATHQPEDLAGRVALVFGDILELAVDAIVNPAHADLLGGGGLDGMIHEAAGPELAKACSMLGGCEVGDAKATAGFALEARWVVHTVGPIWRGGDSSEHEMLASCYRRSLEVAAELGVSTLAFPGISTGLHRFPVDLAASIAVREVRRFLLKSAIPRKVLFVCFDASSMNAYEALLARDAAPG